MSFRRNAVLFWIATLGNGIFKCSLFSGGEAFSPHEAMSSLRCIRRSHGIPSHDIRLKTPTHLWSSPKDNDEDITESKRMEMVRLLQKSFYQTGSNDTPRPTLRDTGILTNLPLWRVDWVELPGRANCLNVHEGHYTHMFETILSGPAPWYVGHLHLPGGSKSLRAGTQLHLRSYKDEILDESRRETGGLRSAVVGTLMRISDYRRLTDGRLLILVHCLDRFVVHHVHQTVPYGVADVQILPDMEEFCAESSGKEAATNRLATGVVVQKSFQFHDYECDQVLLPLPQDGEYLPTDGIIGSAIAKLLPFAFFAKNETVLDNVYDEKEISAQSPSGTTSIDEEPPLVQQLVHGGVLRVPPELYPTGTDLAINGDLGCLEIQLWKSMDDFCQATKFVLPHEILCLMPPDLTSQLRMAPPARRVSSRYPSFRRQKRLSFAASAIIEYTPFGSGMRQAWLNTPSTAARLRSVHQCYQLFNDSLSGRFQ